jgi:hypothetical protein
MKKQIQSFFQSHRIDNPQMTNEPTLRFVKRRILYSNSKTIGVTNNIYNQCRANKEYQLAYYLL